MIREPLRIGESEWIAWHDFSYPVIGREDPPELIGECWDFLTEEYSADVKSSPRKSRKVSSELVAARVRASAVGVGSNVDLRRTIERQQRAIERLLAFVPKRAHYLADERVERIARDIGRKASHIFGVDGTVVTVSKETDEESVASYRIVVDVPIIDEFKATEFVKKSIELQHWLATTLSNDELKSVRLLIEPST